MNDQPVNTDGTAASRIDTGAECLKQATSDLLHGTREAVERATDRVEESLHRATDKAAAGAHRVDDTLGEAAARGRAVRDAALERGDVWLEEVRGYVREKPVQSVAIALAAGWLIGRLLRR